MPSTPQKNSSNIRKLAAIVFADIAGYTALMQQDEALALSKLEKFEKVVVSESSTYNGDVIQFYGDGCLIVFDNVNEALSCTLNFQKFFNQQDENVPVRIGIHAGEVIYRDGNVYGDSVNLASRIESMGIPGSILVSKTVQQQIKNKQHYQLISLGFFDFKNVEEAMEVFAVTNSGLQVPAKAELKGKFKSSENLPADKTHSKLIYIIPAVLVMAFLIWRFGIENRMDESNSDNTLYHSLAIFPFENISGEIEYDYLSDGVAESLINLIAAQSKVNVISKYSTFALRDSLHNLSFIQKLLEVDAILMGSVDRIEDDLIFDAEMISVRNKERIWGEKIHGSENDLAEIEKSISQSVLLNISPNHDLKPGEITKKVNPIAYQHFMQGRFLSFGHTQKEIDQSVNHFHKAIEIDPEFAPAYAALANQKFAQARFSNTTRQELIREAKLAINTARNLDPNLPETHLAEANIKFYCDFDWMGAEQSFREALSADPDNSRINADFAFFQCAMNNYEEALALAEKAISLDPVSISSMHIIRWVNLYVDPQRSIREFSKIIELHPNWIWGYAKKGMAEVLVEDYQMALKTFAEVEIRKGDWGGELLESYLAILYKKCGAENLSQEKKQFVFDHINKFGMVDPLNIAILCGGTGDPDKMMEYATQCVEQKSVNVAVMQLPKDLDIFFNDPLNDPRYITLLKQLGFPNN